MKMVMSKLGSSLLFASIAFFLSQSLIISATSIAVEEQKNFYSPYPNPLTPPTSPSYTPRPPRVSGNTPSAPSKPPQNCGIPPLVPTPSKGGGYNPPPHVSTQTPSTPPRPGGGYYYPPPAGVGPTTPISLTPPNTPSAPSLTPPFLPDPNSPFVGTINYWRTHPAVIWGLLGWWGTLGSAFGTATSFPGFGPSLPLPQALSNTRTDGIGALYREGTASFLNSMLNNRFSFTTDQVRESFVAALGSNKAAATQALAFQKANEGRLKPRA